MLWQIEFVVNSEIYALVLGYLALATEEACDLIGCAGIALGRRPGRCPGGDLRVMWRAKPARIQ